MMRMSGPIIAGPRSDGPQVGQRGRLALERGAARAEHRGGDVADDAVDHAGIPERTGQPRSALEPDVPDVVLDELLQHRRGSRDWISSVGATRSKTR